MPRLKLQVAINQHIWCRVSYDLDQWKESCYSSSLRRQNEEITFIDGDGVISCCVNCLNGSKVVIGTFFTKTSADYLINTGWTQE